MEFTAKQLAQVLKGTVDGDENAVITKFAKIEHGKPGTLSFFANPKYEQYVYTSEASIILVDKTFEPKQPVKATLLRVDNAYEAVTQLLGYVSSKTRKARRHRSLRARWYCSTKFGKKVWLGDFSRVGRRTVIGDNTVIHENVTIGDDCRIGKDCIIYPGVRIFPGMVIGDRVILHAGCVIGDDGFGNAPRPDGSGYDVGPVEFAQALSPLAQRGVKLFGGCCGTTPAHIKALRERLPEIIAEGDIYKHEEPGKLYVLHGTSYVVLGSLHGGAKKIITDFISSHDQKKLDFIKKQPRATRPGENKGG